MKIVDIEIYRDGGSIEFTIKRAGTTKHIWLETPFSGEPRELLINSVPIERGSTEVKELLEEVDKWWGKLPSSTRQAIDRRMNHKGPYYNPSPEDSAASDLSFVIEVRDYVRMVYWNDQILPHTDDA